MSDTDKDGFEFLAFDRTGPITILRLNRPDKGPDRTGMRPVTCSPGRATMTKTASNQVTTPEKSITTMCESP